MSFEHLPIWIFVTFNLDNRSTVPVYQGKIKGAFSCDEMLSFITIFKMSVCGSVLTSTRRDVGKP